MAVVAITFEHIKYANVRYVVYPDDIDPWWFRVVKKSTGEEVWERLEPVPEEDWKDAREAE